MTIEAPEPLRDTISAAFDSVAPEEPAAAPEPAPSAEPAPAPALKEDATGRLHGDGGKFVAKEPTQAPQAPQAPTQPAAPAQLERKRPTTWKKDYWDAYDKLASDNPQLADYILQREQEYTRGVSTYAQEWQRAKPLMEAIAPFEPILKQYNIDPAQHTARLFAAHQSLVMGTPDQKLAMFAQLANDYKVPLGNLLYQGQDGQWYLNQPQVQQPQPQSMRPEDIDGRIKAILEQQQIDTEVGAFGGNHPHFEAVRATMAQLLDAGIANGLEDAYARALRMPEHEHLAAPPKPDPQEEARKRTEAARRNNISPRSVTPSGAAPAQSTDLRGTIEAAFDQHTAGRL